MGEFGPDDEPARPNRRNRFAKRANDSMSLNLNPRDNDTSTVLDFVRFVAAFAVLFGHGISYFAVARDWQAPAVPYMQNIGVLVFFVLSGFLIAFVLHQSRINGGSFGSYLIDRLARIYSALVPSMIFVGAIDFWMVSQSVHGHPQYVSPAYWLGNLAMLNGYRDIFSPFFAIPNFGSAGQLWTLAIECHLYVFVGALSFAWSRGAGSKALIVAIIASIVPLSYFSFDREPGAGIVWLWVLGFVVFHMLKGVPEKFPRPGPLLGIVAVTWVTFTLLRPGHEYDGTTYPLLALTFALVVLLTQQTRVFCGMPKTRAFIRYCANFSFTLYLVHHSVIYAMHRLQPGAGWAGVVASIVISVVLSILLAHVGELHHKRLATLLKARVLASHASARTVS
jgi:peptidoglycan/LPS O-acetylase OafA/YrhL